MRAPHRRDISARQDLLGKELRQLFDDYTNEDMPDELMKLAQQLQGAFENRPADASAKSGIGSTGGDGSTAPKTGEK